MLNKHIVKLHQCNCRGTFKKKVLCNHINLLVVLLIASIATGGTTANAGAKLSEKQIRAEIIGHWLTYSGSRGNMELRLGADRKIYGRSTGGHYIQGTYKLKGNRYCSKIKLRNYKEQCGTFTKLGKGRYRYSATGAILQRK